MNERFYKIIVGIYDTSGITQNGYAVFYTNAKKEVSLNEAMELVGVLQPNSKYGVHYGDIRIEETTEEEYQKYRLF